jgi:hypothetical protein
MKKEWYVKTWMPENGKRKTFEQAIVSASTRSEAKAVALSSGMVAAGRNMSARFAKEADYANQWVRR